MRGIIVGGEGRVDARLMRRASRRRRTRRGGRDGVAIAAVALVRPWSAATFAAAAAPGTVTEDLAVTIPPELEVQILRYHHVEKWPVGTIAKQLRVHHTAGTRACFASSARSSSPRGVLSFR